MIKKALKSIRTRYVIRQVQQAAIPAFAPSEIRRYRVLFSGRVQKVGFRLETTELARRLGLTGFCKNLPTGDVFAEFQGEADRIHFLISFMESLKRIHITGKTTEELPLQEESGFEQR